MSVTGITKDSDVYAKANGKRPQFLFEKETQ
jgi:hypothetical protein